jgi:hypothetical protein
MRHFLYPLVLLIALGVLLSAGTANAICFHGELTSSMEADGLHVQITLSWWGWDNCWDPVPVVVDVYRRTLGSECGPMVLLTETPVSWPGLTENSGPVDLDEVIDGDAEAGVAYEYILRAVGAGREPIPGDDDVVVGYTSVGDVLISHGTLVAFPDCGISGISYLNPCGETCFPQYHVPFYPSEVGQYVNTDTELLVYGHFETEWSYFCNSYVPRAVITSANPGLCVVAVEETTWGVVKSLYR